MYGEGAMQLSERIPCSVRCAINIRTAIQEFDGYRRQVRLIAFAGEATHILHILPGSILLLMCTYAAEVYINWKMDHGNRCRTASQKTSCGTGTTA